MSIIAATILLVSAQGTTAGSDESGEADPMVCEKQGETGSRLHVRKVCMRRSEWAEKRAQEKQLIDRTQRERADVKAQ